MHAYNHIENFIIQALEEDLGRGDLYALVADDIQANARVVAKESGIFSGKLYLDALIKRFDVELAQSLDDGVRFCKGDVLCELRGWHIALLQLERVLLNILSHSSGIATLTAQYVDCLSGMPVRLLDTRKTRPLLREFEKYSVRNGGGYNHRFGLDSLLMLKDTHLSKITDLKAFIARARVKMPFMTQIEVECENLMQVEKAIESGVDVIMCDNMSVDQVREVVAYRNANAPHIILEASGNMGLENIGLYASSGVDAISVGGIIHQAKWIDLSMKID